MYKQKTCLLKWKRKRNYNMPAGRPLKYKSVKEIEPLIEEYFNNTPQEEWTITGLALALDTDRSTLILYQGRDGFSNTIKKAKTRVEMSYELSLRKKGRPGDIFGLKNFGWKDKQETDITTKGESLNTMSEEDKKLLKTLESHASNNSSMDADTSEGK
jgi:hypothetical protein